LQSLLSGLRLDVLLAQGVLALTGSETYRTRHARHWRAELEIESHEKPFLLLEQSAHVRRLLS